MDEGHIRDRLVERGEVLFGASRQQIQFTTVKDGDDLLNDLANHPHAFVLACIMDRQIRAERAWLIPYKISVKLGGFSMSALRLLSRHDLKGLMAQPEPLHRFVDKMSGFFHAAVQRIDSQYGGDASCIWEGKPSSAEVVYPSSRVRGRWAEDRKHGDEHPGA